MWHEDEDFNKAKELVAKIPVFKIRAERAGSVLKEAFTSSLTKDDEQ